MTINCDAVKNLISNNEAFAAFQKELLQGTIEKWDVDEFIYCLRRLSHNSCITRVSHKYDMATIQCAYTNIVWWGDENPESLSITDAYYSALMPTRLACCCLLSILYTDESRYNDDKFVSLLSSALELCTVYGLKYMTKEDLGMTVNALKSAKAWVIAEKYPDMCKAFTEFVHTNRNQIGYVEE